MKKKRIVLLAATVGMVAVLALVLLGSVGFAKRRPPAVIRPVRIRGVEFRAPNKVDSEGIVEAWSLRPEKQLWKKEIYFSAKMPFAEDQGNFMTSMSNGPAADQLTIVNERGGVYAVNVDTKEVKTIKAGRWCWAW